MKKIIGEIMGILKHISEKKHIYLRVAILLFFIVYFIYTRIEWTIKAEGIENQIKSVLETEYFSTEICFVSNKRNIFDSYFLCISPQKSAQVEILWNKSSYLIDGKNEDDLLMSERFERSKKITQPVCFIIFENIKCQSYSCKRKITLPKNVSTHTLKLVFKSNDLEYTQQMETKIIKKLSIIQYMNASTLLTDQIFTLILLIIYTITAANSLSSRKVQFLIWIAAATYILLPGILALILTFYSNESLLMSIGIAPLLTPISATFSFLLYFAAFLLSKKTMNIVDISILNTLCVIISAIEILLTWEFESITDYIHNFHEIGFIVFIIFLILIWIPAIVKYIILSKKQSQIQSVEK